MAPNGVGARAAGRRLAIYPDLDALAAPRLTRPEETQGENHEPSA